MRTFLEVSGIVRVHSIGQTRRTKKGNTVLSVALAYGTDFAGTRVESVQWMSIWNRNAEFFQRFCESGTPIFMKGQCRIQTFTDSTGKERSVPVVDITYFDVIETRAGADARRQRKIQRGRIATQQVQVPEGKAQQAQPKREGLTHNEALPYSENEIPF